MIQSLKVKYLTALNSSPPLHSTLNFLPIKALTTCVFTVCLLKNVIDHAKKRVKV